MDKYTKKEIYNTVIEYGTDNLMKLILGNKNYSKLKQLGKLTLLFMYWGSRNNSIPFEEAINLKNLNQINNAAISINNAAISINFKPYDDEEYGWTGYEFLFNKISYLLMDYTFEEKIDIIENHAELSGYDTNYGYQEIEFFLKNIKRDYKFEKWSETDYIIHDEDENEFDSLLGYIYRFTTLGNIEVGEAYATINECLKIKLPIIEHKNKKYFSGAIELKQKIYSIIFTVEKDGLILDKYNFMVQQRRKELFVSEYNYPYITPGTSSKKWLNDYTLLLSSTEGCILNVMSIEAAKAIQHINKIIDYKKANQEITASLDVVVEILEVYMGWRK